MKTSFLTLLLMMALATLGHAQTYAFSVSQDTYVKITEPDEQLGYVENWGDGAFYRTLPFAFKFFDDNKSNVLIDGDGRLIFEYYIDNFQAMDAVGADLFSKGALPSEMSYLVDGEIMKVQWRYAGFKPYPESSDYANFQVWIYMDGVIEFRYGNSSIEDLSVVFPEGTPVIGLVHNVIPRYLYLEGDPASPALVATDGAVKMLNGFPDSGTVYRFTPASGNPPMLSLTSPDGGEKWAAGSKKNITWTSEGVDKVKIEYSVNGGQNWKPIMSGISASGGSFEWTIPEEPTAEAMVKVTDMANSALSSASSNVFTIQSASGIHERTVFNSDLQLYPTPASGFVYLKAGGGLNGQRINVQVYDLSGRLMMSQLGIIIDVQRPAPIDVSTLSKGQYVLTVFSEGTPRRLKLVIN